MGDHVTEKQLQDAIKVSSEQVVNLIKGKLDDTVSAMDGKRAEWAKGLETLKTLKEDVEKDRKTFGDARDETTESLKKFGEDLIENHKAIDAYGETIKSLQALAHTPQLSGSEKDKADDTRQKAIDFFVTKGRVENSSDEMARRFCEADVSEDDIKLYEKGIEAVSKVLWLSKAVEHPSQALSQDEFQALEKFYAKGWDKSGANSFWITPYMSSKIIDCREGIVSLRRFFDSETISREKAVYMVDDGLATGARFKCELDCSPSPVDIQMPGEKEIITHKLQADFCISHQFLEDSERDLEGYMSDKIGDLFVGRENPAFFGGQGVGEPFGLARDESIGYNLATDLSWQAYAALWGAVLKKYRSVGQWWLSQSAFLETLLFTDADGNSQMNCSGGNCNPVRMTDAGDLFIMGRPAHVIDELAIHRDGSNNPIAGSRPVAFGDFKSAYMVVDRKGISLFRDPYTRKHCGMEYLWRSRVGGDVLCSNAVRWLQMG